MAPNLSFGSGVFDHLVLTGSPDPRQHPFGSGHSPVSGQLCGTTGGGPAMCVPVSCRLSATGIRFPSHPTPAGGLGLPCGRLTGFGTAPGPDPIGVPTFHTHEMRPGRVPPVSRGRRCSPGRQKIPGRRLPLSSGQPLHPACNNPSAKLTHNETSNGGSLTFTRPVCPLPVTPGMEQGSFGFPPSFAPRRCQRRTSRAGPGHRALTWSYATGIGRTSDLRARSLRATSCRTFFLVSTLMTGWPAPRCASTWALR